MYGLVDHDVVYLAGHRVIIGKCTTNRGISVSAEGGVIPFDNNRSVVLKHRGLKHTCQCVSQVPG